MGQHTHIMGGNLVAVLTSDGSTVKPDENGDCTLTAATYVFVLGGTKDEPLTSVHIRTDAVIAGTFTIEDSNLARYKGGEASGTADVTDWDIATTGNWIKEDPSTAYVATVGSGWTVTNLTLTKTAAAGGAMIHLGNSGAKRLRLKAVIGTGGKVRVAVHGKSSG